MSTTSPEILVALEKLGLAHEASFLAPHATVEIALLADPAAPPRVGMSRLGGMPDVPPDFAWPCHRWPLDEVAAWPDFAQADLTRARSRGQVRDEDGHLVMPLPFLGQIDLAAVRAFDPEARLPARGLLLFFASVTTDVEDPRFAKRVASAVVHVAEPREALRPMATPPMPDSLLTGTIALRCERRLALDLSWEDGDALRERTPAKNHAALSEAIGVPRDALFAAPMEECQGPMPPEGEVALLRVIEHHEIGFFVGDASWVTFAIPEADLRAGRFEAARASVYIG
jgi:hypothetical protein